MTDAHEVVNETVKYYGIYGGGDGANLPVNYELAESASSCDGQCLNNNVDLYLALVPEDDTPNWAVSNYSPL